MGGGGAGWGGGRGGGGGGEPCQAARLTGSVGVNNDCEGVEVLMTLGDGAFLTLDPAHRAPGARLLICCYYQ